MNDALRIISDEHRNMWRVLVALDEMADDIAAGGPCDARPFLMIFDYIATYVDRMHHAKEDGYLFRLLRNRDPEAGSLLDTLEADHAASADRLDELRTALVAAAEQGKTEPFLRLVKQHATFGKSHIHLEEQRILPMARAALTAEDWAEISAAFGAFGDPLFGEEAQSEYREAFHRIASLAPDRIGLGGTLTGALAPAAKAQSPVVLEVRGLTSNYGPIQALHGIDLEIRAGELVALVGANGAGKTTLLKAISGVQPVTAGAIRFEGVDITRLKPDQRVRLGIAQVPEGRQVFAPLSVEDNLRLGGCTQPGAQVAMDLKRIWEMFPVLWEKRGLPAGTLSGGQQQILAIGRALMARPRLLLLDEPSMGLAPLLVEEVFNVISALKAQGITIFLVEQNAFAALEIAERGYVLEAGAIALSGAGRDLLENEEVKAAYLGM